VVDYTAYRIYHAPSNIKGIQKQCSWPGQSAANKGKGSKQGNVLPEAWVALAQLQVVLLLLLVLHRISG